MNGNNGNGDGEKGTGGTLPERERINGFGPVKRRKFLEAYRQSANIRASCDFANVGRTEYYRTMKDDPEFAHAVAQAEQEAIDRLEAKAWSNALVKDREYSLWNLLRAHRPQKYGSADGQFTRSFNLNVDVDDFAQLTDEQLARAIVAAKAVVDTLGDGAAQPLEPDLPPEPENA